MFDCASSAMSFTSFVQPVKRPTTVTAFVTGSSRYSVSALCDQTSLAPAGAAFEGAGASDPSSENCAFPRGASSPSSLARDPYVLGGGADPHATVRPTSPMIKTCTDRIPH